ncbi:MAG: hypothetical protein ABSC11_07890 [Smithella sp.]|jgi:hypothetical protein
MQNSRNPGKGVDCECKKWKNLFHVFRNVVSLRELKIAGQELSVCIEKHIYKD